MNFEDMIAWLKRYEASIFLIFNPLNWAIATERYDDEDGHGGLAMFGPLAVAWGVRK